MRMLFLIIVLLLLLIGCEKIDSSSSEAKLHQNLLSMHDKDDKKDRKYCNDKNPECKQVKLDTGIMNKMREITGLEDIALLAAIDVYGEVVLLENLDEYEDHKNGKTKKIEKRDNPDVTANGPVLSITATPNEGSQCVLWAYNKTTSSGVNYANYCLWWK